VDLVLCADDIKMAVMGVSEARKQAVIEFEDAVLAFTQWFGAGCALGVNAKWAKTLMGLDHDGDLVALTNCTHLPKLFAAVKTLAKAETPKLDKSKSPIKPDEDKRAEMIRKSMSNIVGFATVIMASTYMTTDRKETAISLGFKHVEQMDYILNRYVKIGTDGFKTNEDTEPVERHLGVLQSKMIHDRGQLAPWTKWLRDTWAFKRGIPAAEVTEGMADEEKKRALKPFMNGTIAEICRLTLPNLTNILEEPIQANLLSYYRNWGPSVDQDHMESAMEMQLRFNAAVKRVNFSSPEDIAAFKVKFGRDIDQWVKDMGYSREEAAAALWRVAHSSRSENASGASIFIGMPKEAEWIVREKPGLKEKVLKTVVVGLAHQLPGVDRLTATVNVIEYKQAKGKVTLIRKCLCAEVPGQKQPSGDYPTNMLCMVAVQNEQPEVGQYLANIWPISEKAWGCELIQA
jgi:hypothetical protein